MPFSSGTFTLTAGTPFVTGTTISSSVMNDVQSDIANNGLTLCLLKDGTQTVTANIPFGGFRLTNIGAASARTDAAQAAQVQNSAYSVLSSVAGTNTITAATTPALTAYTVGQRFGLVPAATNTGATTLNISSLGAGAVQSHGAACVGGELIAGVPVEVYVTTATPVFEITNSRLNAGAFDLSVGSLVGVKFDATQNASADANTLDDYEEGTFTPGVSFGGGTTGITYSVQVGHYTKIGNRVIFSLKVTLSNKGSSTGTTLGTGLPFTSANVSNLSHSTANAFTNINLDTAGGYYSPATGVVANGTTLDLLEQGDNVTPVALTDADFGNTSGFDIAGQYRV